VKIVKHVQLGQRETGPDWAQSLNEIEAAISAVVWPPKAPDFTIHPQSGKKSGEGNGVKPIHKAFLTALAREGWSIERNPFYLDAVRQFSGGYVGVEWETGNISSTHRALNRLRLAQHGEWLDRRHPAQDGQWLNRQRVPKDEECIGGVLILPTRKLYRYLTDRVGNFEEIQPWLELYNVPGSVIRVYAIEHDREDLEVERIKKGTDGRALL
jgi:hypothetical protein